MAAAASSTPLVARSADGSLVGIHHHQDSSSSTKTGSIRCYDGSVSSGSLKFTLRVPLQSSSSSIESADETTKNVLHKLVFTSKNSGGGGKDGSPSHLCGMLQSSSSVLIWDLDRGVLATTLDVRQNTSSTPKKKKRKSAASDGNEIVCDIAAEGGQLFALVFFPDGEDSSPAGKCRIYQYDLSAGGVALVKKIKVGSFKSGSPASCRIAVSKATVAIRMGGQLRVMDSSTGEKLSKTDIPADVLLSNDDEETDSSLEIAPEGRYMAVGANSQAILFSCDKNNDDGKQKLQPVALLSAKDDSPISHLDIALSNEKELTLLAFQSLADTASLFTVSTKSPPKSPLSPQMPQAQLRTDEKDSTKISLIHAGFHPRRPDREITLLFQRKKRGGSAAGSGTHLPMESLSYVAGGLKGTTIVGASLLVEDKKKEGKKRKSAESVALAPGDQGREASSATDLTLGKKKAKVKNEGDDEDESPEDDFEGMEEEGELGQSIAERLALLSSAMEQTDEEDDDDEDEEERAQTKTKDGKSKFKPKSATSETLTALLTQALSSNDAVQLNVALQVTDRRLVEGTVRALQSLDAERASEQEDEATTPGYIPTLMAHIVRRMARRHSLVMSLGVWVRAILAAAARGSTGVQAHAGGGGGGNAVEERMAREAREMAAKLGPLKNFLNERVESFPQLLRLEGRLALLNQQL